ncbi:hypothetical protein ABBQ32_006713 [Trebouxia sp. C0010 RCD-2024]
MPAMENPYPHLGQPLVPVFPAQQAYDSAAVYNIPPAAQPPPPPKWPQSKNLQGKRGGYNKHNFRMPSTKVNIKRIRKQNAQGTRGYVGKGARTDASRNVSAAPYNSNAYLSKQSARREGFRDNHRGGRGGKKVTKARSAHTIREQTPSTIQQTPHTLSTRLCVPPTEAGWTAGSDTLTSAEVAVGNNFDPLGSCMLLKKDYDFGDEEYSSCGGESDSGNDEVLDPNSKAYQKLPTAVKKQLQSLSGQVESLHDENKKLKERLELQASAAMADGMCDHSEMSAEDY